MQAEVKVEFKC